MKKKATFLTSVTQIERVYGPEQVARVSALCEIVAASIPNTEPETVKIALRGAEIVMSTWGMPKMTEDILDAAPDLQIIIYGASSVKGFVTDAVYDRGITVTTAAAANGRSVAEFTMAVITLSLKNVWAHMDSIREQGRAGWKRPDWGKARELYQATIGVISASSIGRELLRLLRSHECNVLVYDPHLTPEEAVELGASKTDLDDLVTRSDVVSLHAPNLPELRHMIGAHQFKLMKDGAVFVNTARGALVDEDALVAELRTGRIMACLDVTHPEPPDESSLLYSLPNCILTPHLAGAHAMDCRSMGALCVEELERYLAGKPPLHPVTRARLPITS